MKSGAMTGAQIARKENITRQDVSQILKRGMGKVFWAVFNGPGDLTAFDVMVEMSLMFEVERTEEELSKFYRLYPEDIKRLIQQSVAEMEDAAKI